ncbi:ammonium transporter [Hymenobacter rubidus]|uniref:ammonium transporter n=1 Tax=Hymenobacter rubidus TaxID=1441626 RepID=UPI00191D4577|nr:ammonium transporter [Hymenobacter rubidus]
MPEPTPWPRFCAEPEAVLAWLNTVRPQDRAGAKAVLTLRWLLGEELERRRPGPVPAAITQFTPDNGPVAG